MVVIGYKILDLTDSVMDPAIALAVSNCASVIFPNCSGFDFGRRNFGIHWGNVLSLILQNDVLLMETFVHWFS